MLLAAMVFSCNWCITGNKKSALADDMFHAGMKFLFLRKRRDLNSVGMI